MPVNSLYFTAAQLLIDAHKAGDKVAEFQINQWTLEQIIDETKLLAPHQWTAQDHSTELESPIVGRLLDVPVRINAEMRNTQVVIILDKSTLDKPKYFVVQL